MKPSPEEAPAVDSLATQDVTLTEFCMRLSASDRRVEMIAGFEHSEKAAGRIKDAESAFASRFAAFVNKPV